MKRIWIGAALLAIILVAGLWTGKRMEQTHTQVARQLRLCAEAAQAGQWDRADALARDAKDRWDEEWDFAAALVDHTVLDEIDNAFEQLRVFLDDRDPLWGAVLCAELAQMVETIQEAHQVTWRNLL